MPRPCARKRLTLIVFLVPAIAAFSLPGCSRNRYRAAADRESYNLIESRQNAYLWDIPSRRVEPSANSRMYLATEQDCKQKPIDDPAANHWMNYPDGKKNTKYYSRFRNRLNSENPTWQLTLPRRTDGSIKLTQDAAIDLALEHSREFQTQYEIVYLTALNLSGNRFEFDTQWFGGNGAQYSATGADLGDQRRLDVTLNRLGFRRNLAAGGQFSTNLLNSMFWDFGSNGLEGSSASLVTTFTQPLLRGAYRHVRLENLTQAERDMLYAVRDFARFRRLFYVDISSSYLNLLNQSQSIRNLQANVDNLRSSLTEYEFYVQLQTESQIQRDQVFLEYQDARLFLLSAQQSLIESFDQFKFSLGLPSWVPLQIDEALLQDFELVNPKLEELQVQAQDLYVDLMQYLPPTTASLEQLQASINRLSQLRNEVAALIPEITQELERWQTQLKNVDASQLDEDDRLDFEQQKNLAQRVQTSLDEISKSLEAREKNTNDIKKQTEQLFQRAEQFSLPSPEDKASTKEPASQTASELVVPLDRDPQSDPSEKGNVGDIDVDEILQRDQTDPKVLAWESVQSAVGDQLRSEIVDLYIIQTQVRLYLIDIDPLPTIQSESAISYAFQNRLDLMNSRAQVVDAFRKVEVAANALRSDLAVTGQVALGSDPGQNNPYRFDSSANRYTVGVEFDGPLNRLNERNNFRARQVAYQQRSRNFIGDRDRVANEIRSILRQIELSRLSFQISRQQVVAATRQVDEAQINLRSGSDSDSVTLFLLQALQGVLSAKNNLIESWIDYRVQKMRLYAALELLYLDDLGHWVNEDQSLEELARSTAIDREYFTLPQFDSQLPSEFEADLDVPPEEVSPQTAPAAFDAMLQTDFVETNRFDASQTVSSAADSSFTPINDLFSRNSLAPVSAAETLDSID